MAIKFCASPCMQAYVYIPCTNSCKLEQHLSGVANASTHLWNNHWWSKWSSFLATIITNSLSDIAMYSYIILATYRSYSYSCMLCITKTKIKYLCTRWRYVSNRSYKVNSYVVPWWIHRDWMHLWSHDI